ncbi:hypothetical protein GOP47_0021946 [Adiantum capillus-veneris]|uniref:CHD3-type chromatin-remodeling factor PICKLE n=1 Tax=Adiantum capillus-veneris TaxID=13818 RepID=A0A9D4Z6N8_ADICA|nr:hypothetical protein GOP47_0021946 [Adiantum capillus-veneris]
MSDSNHSGDGAEAAPGNMSGDEDGLLSTGDMEKGDADADDTDDGLTAEEPAEKPERLRQRSAKKLSYAEDADEEMDWESDEGRDIEQLSSKAKKKKQKADSCSVCGSGDKLTFCYTCPEAYHPSCLTPPLKVAPRGRWSCPHCVDPMSEIDKFLDCQMRPQENLEETDESKESLTRQYLVKWKSRSYLHCSWLPETELEKAVKLYSGLKMKLNNFRRQLDSMKGLNAMEDEWTPIRPEWTTVEKVLDSRQTGEVKEYLVKWKELGYEDISWEVEEDIATFQAQIDRFNKIKSRRAVSSTINPKKRKGPGNEKETSKKRKEFKAFEETPKCLTGGVLHPYQLEGLNFLRFAWQQGQHVILADEMGLGKTIQSIAFLASLMEEGASIPHLVVAPLSTLRNWEREFSTWAPHINVVMYVGSAQARAVIRDLEFYLPKEKVPQKKKKQKKKAKPMTVVKQSKQERIKFDVLLTSYEMINFDSTVLKAIKWECLIVDEGHRLKNKDSKLFQTLHQYTTRHRVLLTGTPLQNNLDELFMLMHFLDAGKFANLEDFQEEFKDLNQEEQVGRLHKMLAPHLLRRVKKDVMKDLPPKKELILRVELSSLQKEYYKAILTRNYQLLSRKGGPQISLNNVVMELRKLCGHPYLLPGVEEEMKRSKDTYRQLLEASGKLVLMDKMMVKLKEQGHRVLIYSQFKIMLDIIEDWLTMKKWSYERIDGNISGSERQIRIDRFNAPNSKRFCFLLSTRAGGLGINLATADTVIIYDSDWNPHADLQAMARAHRLGQTNKVMIYRLVTRGSIEERMMQMTKKKMVLEHLVVGRLKHQQVLNQEELDDILRYGAKELFADENDEKTKSQQIHYDDAAIDRLLDRSQVEDDEVAADEEDTDLLKAFKVANFEYKEDDGPKEAEGSEDAKELDSEAKAQYWDDLLKQRYEEQQQRDAAAQLGKGKRARRQVFASGEDDLAGMASVSSDDEDEEPAAETIAPEAVKEIPDGFERRPSMPKKKPRVDSSEPAGPPPLIHGEGKSLKILGFNRKQRAAFVQILMRFGLGDFSWSEFLPRMKPKTAEEITRYGTLFLTHIAEDISDSPNFSDGVPKEGLRIQDVLVRLAILHLIQDKVKDVKDVSKIALFSDDVYKRLPGLVNARFWKEPQDWKLLQAILKHGYGRWQEIIEDTESDLKSYICKELQLPSSGNVSMLDGSRSPTKVPGQEGSSFPKEEAAGQAVGINSNHAGGQEDGGIGFSATERPDEHRIHKRMVEFLKKRVVLLERALNAEYHQESLEESKVEGEAMEDAGQTAPQATGNDAEDSHPFLTLLAPEEISAYAYDNEPRRLEVARIYNEICRTVNECEVDAAETYTGNKSAGIRLRKSSRQVDGLSIDMQKAFVSFQSTGFGDQVVYGANIFGDEADAISEELDEDEADLDSDGEGQQAAAPSGQKQEGSEKPNLVYGSINSLYSSSPGMTMATEFPRMANVPAIPNPQNNYHHRPFGSAAL